MARLPSKLPTRDDLGPMPSARTGRHIARINPSAMAAPGRALASVGQAISGLGGAVADQQNRDEQFEIQRRLIDTEIAEDRTLEESRRNIEGDGSGFANSAVGGFDENGSPVFGAYDERARTVYNEARESGRLSPRGLAQFDIGLLRLRRQLHGRASGYEMAARNAHAVGEARTALRGIESNAVLDPARLGEFLERGRMRIDAAPFTPAQREAEWERFRLATQRAVIEQRAASVRDRLAAASAAGNSEEVDRALQDLEQLRRDIRTLPGRDGEAASEIDEFPEDATERPPPHAERSGDRAAARSTRAGTFIPRPPEGWEARRGAFGRANFANDRTFGPRGENLTTVEAPNGATFSVNARAAGNFQGFLNELHSRGYNIVSSGGFANRNIRGSSRVSQHAYGNAIDINAAANPLGSSEHDLPDDVAEIAARHGLTWGGNFSGRPDPMHFEFHAAHGVPMRSLDEINRLASAGGAGGRTRLAQAETAAATDAPSGARLPATSGYTFSERAPFNLSIGERRTIENALRPLFRASVLPLLRQGAVDLLEGREPTRDNQGRDALAMAAPYMTDLQRDTWTQRWTEARQRHQATAPLYQMTPEEISVHVARQPANVSAIARRVGDRILEARERDPVRWAIGGDLTGRGRRPTIGVDHNGMPLPLTSDGEEDIRIPMAPEVRSALAEIRNRGLRIQATQDDEGGVALEVPEGMSAGEITPDWHEARTILSEALLAAQRRVGVPERDQAIITRREAENLLDMPRRVNDDEFGRRMRLAADRAYELYGPYARRVLGDAVRFRANLTNNQSYAVDSLLNQMIDGVPIRPEDLDNLRRMHEIDREEMAWRGITDMGTLTPGIDLQGATGFGPQPVMPGRTHEGLTGGIDVLPAPAEAAPPSPGMFDRLLGRAPPPSAEPDYGAVMRRATASGEGVRRTPSANIGAGVTVDPGGRAGMGQPTPEDIAALQRNPSTWMIFDGRFGKGASAAYLQAAVPTR